MRLEVFLALCMIAGACGMWHHVLGWTGTVSLGETVISAFRRIRWTNQIYPNVDTNLPNYMVSHSVHLFWKNVKLLVM